MTDLSDDKKGIELEEKEKSEDNRNVDKITEDTNEEALNKENVGEKSKKIKSDNIKEVKPKKIPTGGILMPGFFTRSKSKEKCKDSDSLNERADNEETNDLVEKSKEETQSRIKLPNPFRKSKLFSDEEGKDKAEQIDKKKLLEGLKSQLSSVFSRRKDAEQNLESQTKAGLASMETLDETDKSADIKSEEKIAEPTAKDVEKQELNEEFSWRQKVKAYRFAISALLVFILFLIVIISLIVPSGKNPYEAIVKDGRFVTTVTSCGLVEGILDDGAVAFRGIPYARSPINELRFKPAKPLDNLEYCWNGTFLAHNATETCLQIFGNGTLVGIEDCLTIDVVTPYVRYNDPLPVIVLIGAESFMGGSPGKMRPSARYARSRDVLFVRPNFRMGALGFLALDILSKDEYPHSSGNYALSDIIAALNWVQLNIQHFGGDPKAVTLFGHRAGATLVTALTTIKGAEKLFARAWATSGGAVFPSKLLSDAVVDNESYLSAVDCKDVECLRNMSAIDLMEKVEDYWRKPQLDLPEENAAPEKRHEWLVIDGKILKESPATVWSSNKGPAVKLVLGSTAHSAASTKLLLKHKTWTEDLVSYHVRKSNLTKLNLSEDALQMYPKTYKGLSQMISDIRIVCPLLAISAQMPNSSFYVVTQVRGEQNISDVDSDVDAILGRYEPKTPEQRRYFSAIQQLFYHFVWNGKVHPETHAKVLIAVQDVLPAQNYSHCDFWMKKNVVLTYGQLD